jgi:hypothetical protein
MFPTNLRLLGGQAQPPTNVPPQQAFGPGVTAGGSTPPTGPGNVSAVGLPPQAPPQFGPPPVQFAPPGMAGMMRGGPASSPNFGAFRLPPGGVPSPGRGPSFPMAMAARGDRGGGRQ